MNKLILDFTDLVKQIMNQALPSAEAQEANI